MFFCRRACSSAERSALEERKEGEAWRGRESARIWVERNADLSSIIVGGEGSAILLLKGYLGSGVSR